MDAVMSRYRYASRAVVAADRQEPHVAELHGQVGTRLPHLWLRRGDQCVSTLDECGPGFAVFTDEQHSEWISAASDAQATTGIAIAVVDTRHVAPDGPTWRTATRLSNGGALLVRLEQHVAARSDATVTPTCLATVLSMSIGG